MEGGGGGPRWVCEREEGGRVREGGKEGVWEGGERREEG